MLYRPPYSPYLAPRDIHFFWPLKRRSIQKWTLLKITRGGEGGGSCLVDTAIKRLLFPRNLCLSRTYEGACRTWWELQTRLLSLCCICFAIQNIVYFFRFLFEWLMYIDISAEGTWLQALPRC